MKAMTYLFFDGCCEEALDFYRQTLGAEVTELMRYKDGPPTGEQCGLAPNSGDKIMHCRVQIGDTTVLASDGKCGGKPNFQGFSLCLVAADDAQAHKLFTALADGGQINMPLAKTFFASSFGMLADRFGVPWMIITSMEEGS